MAEFELQPGESTAFRDALATKGLADASVMANAVWFVQLRWIVATVFVASGAAGVLFGSRLAAVGLRLPYRLLWVLAGVLVVANGALARIVRRFDESTTHRRVMASIWAQISIDLLVVTVLVYEIGTVATFAAFTYLFHIVLACIFFPPRESLLVTCIASALYLATVALEAEGILPERGILLRVPLFDDEPFVRVSLALFGVAIWFTVWFITSTLSRTVRRRDRELSVANLNLNAANEEKNRQMLITTHDLKAPFAGIESHINVLKYQYWSELPEEVRMIIDRIDDRAHMLRDRINAILVLGNLKSKSHEELEISTFELGELLDSVVDPLKESAASRSVGIERNVPRMEISGDRKQLAMLFANLVSNAITYSTEGGTVRLGATAGPDGAEVSVTDDGIGIREDALPMIFDEYFRTQEATRHNRHSTGLGLAIVKVIASRLRLRVRVRSEVGVGTEFLVTIPEVFGPNTGG